MNTCLVQPCRKRSVLQQSCLDTVFQIHYHHHLSLLPTVFQSKQDISAYTYERTLMMEQRTEMLRSMRLSKPQVWWQHVALESVQSNPFCNVTLWKRNQGRMVFIKVGTGSGVIIYRAANHYALGVIYHAQVVCIMVLRPWWNHCAKICK